MLAPKIVSLHGEDVLFFYILIYFRSLDTLMSYISIVAIKLTGSQVTEKRH